MTHQEKAEWRRLTRLWVLGRATMPQMLRCLKLSRKAENEGRVK